MNRLKQILIIVCLICVAGCVASSKSSMPPKEDIPKNIPTNVRKQIERLYSSDALERGRAAHSLGHTAAVLFLIGILGDSEKLYWQKLPTTSGPWRGTTSPGQEAAKALVKIGEPAVEPLIAALDDKPGIRIKAAIALGEIGDTRAVEPLIAKLKFEKNIKEKEVAAEALGKIGDTRAVEPLIATLNKKDFFRARREVRIKAAIALGEIGDARAVEPLIAALNKKDFPDPRIRNEAAIALGKIGDARAVEPLITALKDNELIGKDEDRWVWVRERAAEALGKIGDPRAIDSLIAVLKDKDEDWRVRESTAIALGKIGDARAVEPLITALKDESSATRNSAARALKRITKQDFGFDQAKWEQWWDENNEEILKDR